jgi:ATP-binding cassette subfamily A (ABC1) protein 3
MMFIDFFYIGVLAWYFDKVWPTEFGTHKKWYFCFMPDYWTSGFRSLLSMFSPNAGYKRVNAIVNKLSSSGSGAGAGDEGGVELTSVAVEQVTENLSSQSQAKSCVEIKGLYKAFETPTGKKVAVDGLNLTMYSGQITALLGTYAV